MRKPRWQMSLGTFLLLLTVIVLGVSHYLTSRQLAMVRDELVDYRYQYGHLFVDDPARPHLLRYVDQKNPWKWHVNFPRGKSYRLVIGMGHLPNDEIPNVAQLRYVQATSIVGTGENATMFVSLEESDAESLRLSIGCDGAQTVSQTIPKSDMSWYARSVFTIFSVGHREPFVAEPDAPFVVFSYRERKSTPGGGSAIDMLPTEGVVVWAVPMK